MLNLTNLVSLLCHNKYLDLVTLPSIDCCWEAVVCVSFSPADVAVGSSVAAELAFVYQRAHSGERAPKFKLRIVVNTTSFEMTRNTHMGKLQTLLFEVFTGFTNLTGHNTSNSRLVQPELKTHLHLEHCQAPHSPAWPSQAGLSHSRSTPRPSRRQSRQTADIEL